MNIIIVGCGRVGVELALALHQDHVVSVVDRNSHSFDRLGLHFSGRTIQGHGMDRWVLERAGIENANALATVTSSDNVNAIVARVARDIYRVNRVVARVYNPRRASIYEKLNLQTVSSSTWGAHRIEQLLVHPGMQSISSAGNGEVQVYEMTIPSEWSGHLLSELVPMEHSIPVALARNGKGILPRSETILEPQDILQVSSTPEGVRILRERIHENGNGKRKE
ncbi:MAG TPA: TrkA family potassium uptake protein [Anaerolineales bacterium]|nr:TrkA family potassium uptake protein [Anaerolineales bacterium]